MITLFENFQNKPNVDSVSPEFWEMVKIADWNKVIKGYKENPIINDEHKSFFKQAQNRIYSRYSYEDILKFKKEYNNIYYQLYDYFDKLMNDEKYSQDMPSLDGYSDLLSSVIGKGKKWTETCIDNTGFFIQMSIDEDYEENFSYLLNISKQDYNEVTEEFNPILKDTRKYNV